MAQHTGQHPRSIDVTGLPEEAVRALESLVFALRNQTENKSVGPTHVSYEEWSKAFRQWVASHPKVDTVLDDSRDSIYPDRA